MASHPLRRACGLTLIETMVGIGIVAVLMSLAVPSFAGMLARQRLKAAAEMLSLDLAEARFEAAQRGRTLHLPMRTGPDWCWALATSADCDCGRPQPCRLKAVSALDHPGVQLVAGTSLRFAPASGVRADSTPALLQVAPGQQLRIGLSPLGRPKVCAPQAVVPGYPGC